MTGTLAAPPEPRARSTETGRKARLPEPVPLLVVVCTAVLFFLRFGYSYGAGDQDEIVPFLLHRLDPNLLSKDWFVHHQMETFSVRLYVVLVLQILAQVMPAWLAVLLAHVTSFVLLAWSILLLTKELTGDRLAATLAVPALLVLTPQWTLGGNDLIINQLTPTAMASAAALFGVWLMLKGRHGWGGICLGIGSCFQLLVGFHVAVLLGLHLLILAAQAKDRSAVAALLRYSAAYALAAAPVLVPVLLQQLGSSAEPEPDSPSFFYILGVFRAPHHYLFHSFPVASYLRFGLLAGVGGAALLYLHRRGGLAHSGFVLHAVVFSTLLMLFGYALTEVFPSYFILKLQLFKFSVFLKVIFIAAICGAAAAWLPNALRKWIQPLLTNGAPATFAAILLIALATVLVLVSNPLRERVGRWGAEDNDLRNVERWATQHTPKDALFVVPPSANSFRSRAQRAVVVTFKAFPLVDRPMQEWMERIQAVSPIGLPERGGGPIIPRLDAALARQSPEGWRRLLDRHGVDYIVSRERVSTPEPRMRLVYTAGTWEVHRVERP